MDHKHIVMLLKNMTFNDYVVFFYRYPLDF